MTEKCLRVTRTTHCQPQSATRGPALAGTVRGKRTLAHRTWTFPLFLLGLFSPLDTQPRRPARSSPPYLLIVPLQLRALLPADVTRSATVQIHPRCRLSEETSRNSERRLCRLPSPGPRALAHAAMPAVCARPAPVYRTLPRPPPGCPAWALGSLRLICRTLPSPATRGPPGTGAPAWVLLTFPAPVQG